MLRILSRPEANAFDEQTAIIGVSRQNPEPNPVQ